MVMHLGPRKTDSLTHGNKDENLVIKSKPLLPIAKSRISYVLRQSDNWKDAIVLGRAGKASGHNRFHMNIRDDDEESGEVH